MLLGDLEALKEHAWCNFEFLLARLHSSSVHSLLNDLDLTLASVLDADIHLVLQAVYASTRVLAIDALQLASELIGRLRQLTGASLIIIIIIIMRQFVTCCNKDGTFTRALFYFTFLLSFIFLCNIDFFRIKCTSSPICERNVSILRQCRQKAIVIKTMT